MAIFNSYVKLPEGNMWWYSAREDIHEKPTATIHLLPFFKAKKQTEISTDDIKNQENGFYNIIPPKKKTEKWFTTILMGFCFYFSIFFGVTISKFTSHPGYRWHICTGPRTWITFCPRASDALYSKTSNQNIPETAAASPSLSQAGGFNLFQCCKFPWFPAGSWMWFGTFRDSSQISHGFPWYIALYGCGSKWKT